MSEVTQEDDKTEKKSKEEEISFDAVDLMLEGNLQAQINYSMVKGIASALDEKAQILIQAEESFEPQEDLCLLPGSPRRALLRRALKE